MALINTFTKEYRFRRLTLAFLYASLLLVSLVFQQKLVNFSPPYYMVFILGILVLCFYNYYAKNPVLLHTVAGYLFLLMLLFYPQSNEVFYCLTILACIVCCKASINILQPLHSKILWCIVALTICVTTFLLHHSFAFLLACIYLTLHAIAQVGPKRYKWDVLIVDLLFLLAALGSLWPGNLTQDEVIRQNIIFTIPTSTFIYIVLRNWNVIRNRLFLFLKPEPALFLCFQTNFLLFGAANIPSSEDHLAAQPTLFGVGLLLFGLCFLYASYANYKVAKKQESIKSQFETWFADKWELAINQQELFFLWTGFETKLADNFPNDGIAIYYESTKLFASGCFLQPAKPLNSKSIEFGKTRLYIHERAGYQPFSITDYFTAFSLNSYLDDKMNQWKAIQPLKVTSGNNDFSKDLQFRKDVTYYLHDNVLQNIIATKNIVASLPTEQAALQSLAVETLSDLNNSIRSQMHEIYPSTLADLPFERNIHILIDDLHKKFSSLPQFFIQYLVLNKMDEEYSYFFYRSIQELLTNTCKHAQAKNIWLVISCDNSYVLEFSDDGNPFPDVTDATQIKHLGISSLKHQAVTFGGTFEISQEQNKKTFKITLPRRLDEITTI